MIYDVAMVEGSNPGIYQEIRFDGMQVDLKFLNIIIIIIEPN